MEELFSLEKPSISGSEELQSLKALNGPSIDRTSPDFAPQPYLEIQRYLNSEIDSWRGWRKLSRELASCVEKLSPECRLSVAIPVAAHEEQAHIGRTLQSFLEQTADPSSFEIVLFANHPAKYPDGTVVRPDGTLDVIRRFIHVHQDLNIRVMYCPLPIEGCRIGNIRKILSDAILYRYLDRGAEFPDHIIVRADADTLACHPQWVENFINRFDRNPRVDSYLGQLDFDTESYRTHPLLHLLCRVEDKVFTWLMRCNDVQPGGTPNFAIRASTYAWIGGENRNFSTGEDVALTRSLFKARHTAQHFQPLGFAGSPSRLYTSARRLTATFERGFAPAEQWDPTSAPFSHLNGDIRSTQQEPRTLPYGEWIREDIGISSLKFFNDLKVKIQKLNPFRYDKDESLVLPPSISPQPSDSEFTTSFECLLNRSLKYNLQGFKFSNGIKVSAELIETAYKHALFSFGINFEFKDNSFRIVDCSKVCESLEKYRLEGRERVSRRMKTIPI